MRGGWLLTIAIIALGFATLNTGNNLLYLVLGGLLGLIVLSGWLSEQVIRGIRIHRRLPRAITVREPARLTYEITNLKPRFPSIAIELIENSVGASAFLPVAWPGQTASAHGRYMAERRGVYQLNEITIRTGFPFGLFVKERDIESTAALVVWPRTDRIVREPHSGGERMRKLGLTSDSMAGAGRGEYRTLRPYQAGDDPRDVHWRSTARTGQAVVREYERDSADTLWLCLDLRAAADDRAEIAIDTVAALAARAQRRNERFGLATNDSVVEPGHGPAQLEAVLDTLARAQFRLNAPLLSAPVDPQQCVLITTRAGAAGFGDVYEVEAA